MAALQVDMAWMQGGFTSMANGGSSWSGAGKELATGLMNAGLSFLNIPGAIPNGLLHAGGNMLSNGITNAMWGNNFLQGAGWQAGFGFIGGAYSGYQMAKEIGLNPLTGGLNSSDRQIWQAYKNGSMSMSDATAALHGDYYTEAGSPDVTLGTKTNSRGSFTPMDPNGNDIGIIAASRDYSSVGGRIEIHPAGMRSGRRFLFTTYHELTHAKMFYSGHMHNRYRFLEMNYGRFIKTSLPKQLYYMAGLKTHTERWAYGAQWARWRINGSRIYYIGSIWQQILTISPTTSGWQTMFENLFYSF